MGYKTVEVELENGRVRPHGDEALPARAHALLTILEPSHVSPLPASIAPTAGLRRFLATPDFPLNAEQFRASMDADCFEQ